MEIDGEGRLHLWRGSGLHLPEVKMLEELFDDLPILNKTEDLLLFLALGTGQGVHIIDLLDQPGPILSVFFG